VGRNWAYFLMSLTIVVVLALAANTSFGGLPVLASLLAQNNYLPHLYALRDDRQVFASGIWTLAILSGALLVAVGGDTLALIPLYAIGMFTGFTLSQSGLVVHWRRTRPPCWRYRASLNGLGAAITGLATAVFLLTKFTEGAWVVVLAVPAFIAVFVGIHHYYDGTRRALGIGEIPGKPQGGPAAVVVPVTGVSRLTEYGISQALSISRHVLAVTVVHVGARQEPAGQRAATAVGALGSGRAAAGAADRIRLDRRTDRDLRRQAPQAARRADHRADSGGPARPAALPLPAQPPRHCPHAGAAGPSGRHSRPRPDAGAHRTGAGCEHGFRAPEKISRPNQLTRGFAGPARPETMTMPCSR
jgi:hypothetical protein